MGSTTGNDGRESQQKSVVHPVMGQSSDSLSGRVVNIGGEHILQSGSSGGHGIAKHLTPYVEQNCAVHVFLSSVEGSTVG